MEELDILKRKLMREQQARKQAEEIIEQKSLQLYLANRELNDFAHIIAHDLKAPLRAVNTLSAWLVEDYANQLDASGKEQLLALGNKVKSLNNLVDAILSYSKAGRMNEEKSNVDLNKLINEIIQMLAAPSNIKFDIPNNLPIIYYGEVSIRQILQNLISNAIKYIDNPVGEIAITCNIENSFWKICISDNGPGISEKYFEQIFKIFQTLSNGEDKDSTGVGLSIVKKIVETNNGKIWVESEVGQGSTFCFTIPK